MKYKVGDKVKVRSDLVVGTSYNGFVFVEEMKEYLGKECLVTSATRRCYGLNNVDSSEFAFTDEMLEHKETKITLDIAILKRWEELLGKDGSNTKGKVKNEIQEVLRRLEHDK